MTINHLEIDFEKEASEFNAYVDALYSKISNICGNMNPTPEVERNVIQIEEPPYGSFCSEMLTIRTNNKKITFNPIGTMLIGFKGKIQVFDGKNKNLIVLLDDKKTSLKDIVNVEVSFNTDDTNKPNNNHKENNSKKINWVWKAVPYKGSENILYDKFISIDEDFISSLIKQ